MVPPDPLQESHRGDRIVFDLKWKSKRIQVSFITFSEGGLGGPLLCIAALDAMRDPAMTHGEKSTGKRRLAPTEGRLRAM